MFSRFNLTLVLGLAVVGLLLASPAAANLITDPSFESVGTASGQVGYRAIHNSYYGTYASNGDIPGWTSTGTYTSSGVAQFCYGAGTGNNSGLPNKLAEDGSFAWYFRPGYTDVLSQAFTVTPGYTYSLSFWSGVQSGQYGSYSVTLTPNAGTLTGNTTGSPMTWYSFAQSGSALTGALKATQSGNNQVDGWGTTAATGNGGWVQFTASFTAGATTTSVTLLFNNPTATYSEGACLDNVDVEQTATPEPGTLALLAAGLAGLLCYAWRKRR